MNKYTGHWLKRARKKLKITQKDLVGDRFKRQYISMVETGDVGLSSGARLYITKKLKLPKSYFDTGLFKEEKKRLNYLIKETNSLLDSLRFNEANKLIKEAISLKGILFFKCFYFWSVTNYILKINSSKCVYYPQP